MKKLEHVENLVRVEYYAFGKEPPAGSRLPAPDAVGYVPQDKLLPPSDRYIDFAADALKPGYMSVYADGDLYIVRTGDVYTAVYEHTGVAGGWAAEYPAGGIVAAPAPTHEDSAGYYIRQIW